MTISLQLATSKANAEALANAVTAGNELLVVYEEDGEHGFIIATKSSGGVGGGQLVKSYGALQDHLIDNLTASSEKLEFKADNDVQVTVTKAEVKAMLDSEYEPSIANKGTAFNKNFGTATGDVADGKILNDLSVTVGDSTSGLVKAFNDLDSSKASKPVGGDNQANGRVILGANGKIPSNLYESGGVTSEAVKSAISTDSDVHLMTTAEQEKLNAIAEIKSVDSSFLTLDSNGNLSVLPNLVQPTNAFTAEEMAYVRTHLAVNDWQLKRGIAEFTTSGVKKKDSFFVIDDWIKIKCSDEDAHIVYRNNPRAYPEKLKCKLRVDSHSKSKNKDKGRSYNFTLTAGSGERKVAWFDIRSWKDDWDISGGDTSTFVLTVYRGETGSKYQKTYEIKMKDTGGRKISYDVKVTGESLTDPSKVADNTEWK